MCYNLHKKMQLNTTKQKFNNLDSEDESTAFETNLARLNIATSLRPRLRASLKPSEKRITSAISSLSGLDIATGRNSCFRLSGNFCLPPYPFPAGFIVIKIPEFGSTVTCNKNKCKLAYHHTIKDT